jgi:hypothetical protein
LSLLTKLAVRPRRADDGGEDLDALLESSGLIQEIWSRGLRKNLRYLWGGFTPGKPARVAQWQSRGLISPWSGVQLSPLALHNRDTGGAGAGALGDPLAKPELARKVHDNAVRSLSEERAAEIAARTLALPDAQSDEELPARLTTVGER